MTLYDSNELVPVPRHRVFVLNNGTFVVQWEEKRVQSLLTGKYHAYDTNQQTDPITDYELNQLINVGIVHDYDSKLVHLSPKYRSIAQSNASRTYYVNTTLTADHLPDVEAILKEIGLDDRFSVRLQKPYVVIRNKNGLGFLTFDSAEKAREVLAQQALLSRVVVAFTDMLTDDDELIEDF